MKKHLIIAFILIFTLAGQSFSEGKRPARKSMKELTTPGSPSYVPNPYPKTREEIIENIKYCYIDLTSGAKSAFIGGIPPSKKITAELFSSNSRYRIGKIIKVKNSSEKLPDNYTWLIYVLDEAGDTVMRIAQRASGLDLGSSTIDKSQFPKYTVRTRQIQTRLLKALDEKDIKIILSDALGEPVKGKIKKIQQLTGYGKLLDFDFPMWEIKMKNGATYYYNELRDMVYSIDKKSPWKKGKYGRRWIREREFSNRNYIQDSINEQLIFLNPMPRNHRSNR
jgi:hypothetical protein